MQKRIVSRRKTGVVINRFPAISETFVYRQVLALDSIVFSTFYDNTLASSLNIHPREAIVICRREIKWREKWQRYRNKFQGIPYRKWTKKEQYRFESSLDKSGVNIIITPFGTNAINAYKSCRMAGVPMIIQFLGYDASSLLRNRYYCREIEEAMGYAKYNIFLYDGMQNDLIENGIMLSKTKFVNPGVPLEHFAAANMSNEGPFEFLSVGRFVEKKAPLLTLKAFFSCAEKCNNIRLTMVGDGPLLKSAKKYVDSHFKGHQVRFLGFLNQNALLRIYKTSHCFLQHSVTDIRGNKEGWPVSIAEACASALPVVSTYHAGIPTQIKHGYNGFLVREGDWKEMTKYMTILLEDRSLCRDMGQNGVKHINLHGNFNSSIMQLQKLVDI